MRVLLITPPSTYDDWHMEVVKKIYHSLPSLGQGYVAAVLEEAGHVVKIYNGPIREKVEYDEMDQIIKGFKPDVIGFGVMTPAFHRAISASEHIKKNIDKKIPIMLGGSHVTSLPEETFKNFDVFDVGIIGEAEYTTRELMEHFAGKKNLKNIKGIVYRDRGGKVHVTERRPLIKNLDELPFPARHLFDIKGQRYSWFKLTPGIHMVSSRGCPNRCKFCDHAVFGKTNRPHSLDYVIREIEHVVKEYGAKEIAFLDDNFMLNKHRVREFCERILEKGIKIQWQCFGRVNNSDVELYKLMKKAGCWFISFGVESGNQDVLDFINKDITLDQVRKAVKAAKKAGILTRGSFMVGHPIDTKETILQTIEFAKSLPLDTAGFSMFVPYPGSEFFDDAEKYGTFRKNKYYRDFKRLDEDPVFVPKTISKEDLVSLHAKAMRSFYMRPGYVLRSIRNIQSVKHFTKYVIGFWNIFLRDILGKKKI